MQLKDKSGQGLVEFVIVLPVLLVIAIGLYDVGRAFFALITVTNASREGARYLALHPNDNGNSFSDTKAAAVREASSSFVTLATSDVSVTLCNDADAVPGCDSGTRIRVSVSYTYRPIFAGIFPVTLPMTRATEMMVP